MRAAWAQRRNDAPAANARQRDGGDSPGAPAGVAPDADVGSHAQMTPDCRNARLPIKRPLRNLARGCIDPRRR
jgi:hypothetical protein